LRAYNLHERAGGATAEPSQGASQTVWRSGPLLTAVRAEGDSVTILRGREADVRAALESSHNL
jgi:hypothetical protein